jgi:hypothetical protein
MFEIIQVEVDARHSSRYAFGCFLWLVLQILLVGSADLADSAVLCRGMIG